jgi:hypothetical protein
MINETVTSNIIAMKTTPTIHSREISQVYTVASLKKAQTHTSPSQYLFHNQSGFMDGEKDIPVTKSLKNASLVEWFFPCLKIRA